MAKRLIFVFLVAGFLSFSGVIFGQEGPKNEQSETVARPRKKETAESESAKKRGGKDQTLIAKDAPVFRSDVSVVTLEVTVLDNKGRFIPNIPAEHFRVLEDGVEQEVTGFDRGEGPMTVCLLIEFSNLFQYYWGETWHQTLTAAYSFAETLRPEDYVAVVAYDMRPEILSDFSTDKREVQMALQRLRMPAWSESNLFDAITDTAQRMSGIDGRKAIVLISSGVDTFSKLRLDQTRRILQTAGVPIFAIGLMQALREWYDARGYMGSIERLDFLQADNQMRTFAEETGGASFFPRFYGEFPSIFANISRNLRSQYSIVYKSSNQAKDGKFRKIRVELVNPSDGSALRIVNEKGKPIKYKIITRTGYVAPREVE